MAYKDVRDQIETVLAALSITDPITQSIKKVYTEPPGTIQDAPCFVMYGPASGSVEYMAGGAAIEETDTEHVRLLIRDQDLNRAAELTRGYRAALIAAFKTEAGLGGHGVIIRLRWGALTPYSYGAARVTGGPQPTHTGQDIFIEFLVTEP